MNTNHQTRYKSVWRVVEDGQWHTLREISEKSGFSEASVSAQLRDYRKTKYGGHTVDMRSAKIQTHEREVFTKEYKLVPNRVAYDEDKEQFVYSESA